MVSHMFKAFQVLGFFFPMKGWKSFLHSFLQPASSTCSPVWLIWPAFPRMPLDSLQRAFSCLWQKSENSNNKAVFPVHCNFFLGMRLRCCHCYRLTNDCFLNVCSYSTKPPNIQFYLWKSPHQLTLDKLHPGPWFCFFDEWLSEHFPVKCMRMWIWSCQALYSAFSVLTAAAGFCTRHVRFCWSSLCLWSPSFTCKSVYWHLTLIFNDALQLFVALWNLITAHKYCADQLSLPSCWWNYFRIRQTRRKHRLMIQVTVQSSSKLSSE